MAIPSRSVSLVFPHDKGKRPPGGTSILIDSKESGRKAEQNAFNGTRKLIRPHLPQPERRHDGVHTEDPLTHAMSDGHAVLESSHAEAFYFQKQMQQQTVMTVVLEDGEELHGTLEWFDKCVLKLRSGRHRILVYKPAIKYLFKSSETNAGNTVMK